MARLPMPFNNPTTYPGHEGVDYGQKRGTPIPASGPGVISKRTKTERGGYKVWVDYDEFGPGCDVGYAHLDDYTDSPPVGTRVTTGQTIGRVGNTGQSTGPHLHSEVENNFTTDGYWKFFDPTRVVGTPVSGNQRVAGPSGAKARTTPSTELPAVEDKFLPAGTVGNFDGWIHGENVQGNTVWFHGAVSGLWFWSGGFTDTGTHDLTDLNAAGNQRIAGQYGAKARRDPSTNQPAVEDKFLEPGTKGTFDGWINGQVVEGNPVWFRGAYSALWFWSGGFTDVGTHDLADLNTAPEPSPSPLRTVGANPANVRDLPYTDSPVLKSEASGTGVEMNAWAHAEIVQGNDIWFRRGDGDWMWSGGFTETGTAGLAEVAAPPKPDPGPQPTPDNPRGLEEVEPVWPGAFQGLNAPLGHVKCEDPSSAYALRDNAGGNPREPVINMYIIHWTGVLNDQMDYFSYCNDRSSCPTWYDRRDGSSTEFIPPQYKPASSGPEYNYRSVAVESLAAPGSDFTQEQWQTHAERIAWLRSFDGRTLNGVPVHFLIDRAHIKGHRELPGQSTTCPGDAQIAYLDTLIVRAQAIYDEVYGGGGEGPLDPHKYPVLWSLRNELNLAFGDID
jgi:hypothetical protein